MRIAYGSEDVFYVEFLEYGHYGCEAVERHTGIRVSADSKVEARLEMTRLLHEYEMSRPDPSAPVPSVEAIRINRSRWSK